MKATLFMIAGDIGGPHKLTQPQLRELTQSGLVSIQSHGWSHKNMAAMGWTALVCELLRSKLALTLACGRVPTAVSYPNGKCTERTRTAAGWFYAYGAVSYTHLGSARWTGPGRCPPYGVSGRRARSGPSAPPRGCSARIWRCF